MHPSIDVVFGEHFVAELVHIFVILRRNNGEEFSITLDSEGTIMSCFNDLNMDAEQDLDDDELQSLQSLVKKQRVDYT
jgi:hypothetical protein